MKERRRELLCFFSGSSVIGVIEFLFPAYDLRLNEAAFSDFRLDEFSASSVHIPDFLIKGRLDDSLRARGRFAFTACTNSDTEVVAFSFSRAAINTYTQAVSG